MKVKLVLFASLAALLSLGCSSPVETERHDEIRMAMQSYMDSYPQSQLRDVYKFCFQDYFGPEHLVSDSATVASYIVSEIDNADTADWQRPLFAYPLGLEGNFYRVDLGYVRQGIVSVGELASAFVESAEGWLDKDNLPLEEWKELWVKIQHALREVKPIPLNFEEDSALIADALAKGEYAFHHSAIFNGTYRQHYRIIRRDIVEKMLGKVEGS